MDSHQHRDKARRILATARKWDDDADAAALIEGSMHACTHLLNAILHERGLTAPGSNLNHSDRPEPLPVFPEDLTPALNELRWIEDSRALHVRGGYDAPPGTGRRCRAACATFEEIAGTAEGETR